MANYKLDFGQEHGKEHPKLTQDIESFLWTLTEAKELERLKDWKGLIKDLK